MVYLNVVSLLFQTNEHIDLLHATFLEQFVSALRSFWPYGHFGPIVISAL